MGAAFVPALLDFSDPSQGRVAALLTELEAQFPAVDDDDDIEQDDGTYGMSVGAAVDASDKLRRPPVRRSTASVSSSKGNNSKGGASNNCGAGSVAARSSCGKKKEKDDASKKKKKVDKEKIKDDRGDRL